jgi:hypothetical protein
VRRNLFIVLVILAIVAALVAVTRTPAPNSPERPPTKPTPTTPAPAAEAPTPEAEKVAVQAAKLGFTPSADPERVPGESAVNARVITGMPVGFTLNGNLPRGKLAPIRGGRLARGPPAAGWNTLNLYRFERRLRPVETNGPASSYRTLGQQSLLRSYWCNAGRCGNAALPGYSLHGIGNAVDNNAFSWVRSHGRPFRWDCSNAPWEGWHSSFCGGFRRPDPGPDPRNPVLRPGSGGIAQARRVRHAQLYLRRHRIRCKVTGRYTRGTGRCVMTFERRRKFKRPDRVVTRATWLHLRSRQR